MKKILSIGLVLMIGATAWAAHSVDGVITSGEWARTVTDNPDDVSSANTEMVGWGAEVEGGYLYWYCELSAADGYDWMHFQGQVGTSDKKIFPGLWIDADASTSTYLTDGGVNNCAAGKFEWATNHLGIDMNLELGLIGSWTNGSNYAPNGEGPPLDPENPALGKSIYNYWCDNDDVAVDPVTGVTDGSWYVNGYVMEARISLTELAAKIASLPDGVVMGDYMMVGVGVQGVDRDKITYGYDVGTPIPIATDGSAVLVGDANLDGMVDPADYTRWADNYGGNTGWRGGDFNGDNAIDPADYTKWADNYGAGVPSSNIPEPATMSLLGVGILALIRRKK